MKHSRLVLATIILMGSLSVRAQVGHYRSDLAVGGNAGLILNTVSFYPSVAQKMHMGPEVGASVRYTCEKYFSMVCALQVEFNYAQKGWREVMDDKVHKYSRTTHYLNIPFLARLGFGRERKGLQGYLVVGPQFGICLGEDEKYDGDWTPEYITSITNRRIAQHALTVKKRFEYGITAGAGIEFSNPKAGHFDLEARYFYGLTDMFGNSKKDVFGRSANTSIVVKLSYFFDVIKTKTNEKIK